VPSIFESPAKAKELLQTHHQRVRTSFSEPDPHHSQQQLPNASDHFLRTPQTLSNPTFPPSNIPTNLPMWSDSSNIKPEHPVTFYTPQTKLVKPVASAFHSTGFLSKKNRPRSTSAQQIPHTPTKKPPSIVPLSGFEVGAHDSDSAFVVLGQSVASNPPTRELSGSDPFGIPPTPIRPFSVSTVTSAVKPSSQSRRHRSPLQESPIKSNKKPLLNFNRLIQSVDGDENASPTRSSKSKLHSAIDLDMAINDSNIHDQNHQKYINSQQRCSSSSAIHTSLKQSQHQVESPVPFSGLLFGPKGSATNSISPIRSINYGHLASNSSDMMDCDDDPKTPSNTISPVQPTFSLSSTIPVNHTITPYPRFLTSHYFSSLKRPNRKSDQGGHRKSLKVDW
jgi:hypothetical protein